MDGGFVAPGFADWQGKAAALGLRRQGRELVGACPSCGGTDRFAVKPVQGGEALIHCRQCKGFVDILKAAGLAEDRPTNGAAPTREFEYRDLSGEHYHSAFRRGDGPGKKCLQRAGLQGPAPAVPDRAHSGFRRPAHCDRRRGAEGRQAGRARLRRP